METINRHYPLPNKNHDVLEDLSGINEAFTVIDNEVANVESSINSLQSTVAILDAKSLTIPENSDIDTEIQSIKANNYLVTNKNGTGFSTTEGGGNEGGLLAQCLAKISDENYKTAWKNFWEISKHGNEVHILSDEKNTDDQIPKSGLVSQQIIDNTFAKNNESHILRDSIEQISNTENIATRENYGLVKIGDGIIVDEGVIFVPRFENATTDDFGLVKVGDGISVTDGMISVQTTENASSNNPVHD